MDINDEDYLKNLKESFNISALSNMKFRINTMSLFPFLIGIEKSKNMKTHFKVVFPFFSVVTGTCSRRGTALRNMSEIKNKDNTEKQGNGFQQWRKCSELQASHLIQVSPSCFINEMQLTTEQRLEKIIKLMNRKMFTRSCEHPATFRATPHIVLFQSYEPGRTYSLLLNIQNTLQVLRSLRMHCKHSLYFQVTYFSKVSTKVAAGMSVNFSIKFTPLKRIDYYHSITFETEDESFTIPIMAISPRPLLDFPDSVQMDDVIVKVPCHKVLLVQNIGQVPATFSLIVDSPFSVNPKKAVLNINEIIHIQLGFESEIAGEFSRSMVIRYETGEELVTDLQCNVRIANTGIVNDRIFFMDTYMSLKRQMSLSVYNHSNHKVRFCWLKYPTVEHDRIETERMKIRMDTVRETETIKCNKLEYSEVACEELISGVYKRIFDHESAAIIYKKFEYIHPNFTIMPSSGELWPNSSSTVTVIFSPETASNYESIAYCDIGGRDTRIPIYIKGNGLGPVMKFNVDVLDVENIFLCSVNKYEIIVNNCGVIVGHVEYIHQKCVFGGQLSCTPDRHCVAPMEYKAFCISFSSNRHGRFTEDVCFRIVESGQIIKLLLNGFVVNPTLSFSESSLDFGDVAVGFPTHRNVTLNNKSLVEVLFVLYVQSDGTEEPVSYEYFAESRNKPMLTYNAKEFCISPETGVLKPNSSISVQIMLLTNITRKHSTVLIAENRGTEAEPVKLSVTYSSGVTEIICEPRTMLMSFCFIDYPYTREFCLKNTGDLPGYFFLHQETVHNEVSYTTDQSEGLLEPHESVTVMITIKILKKGSFQKDVQMLLFGDRLACIICTISCIGQGPVVTPNETVLNYGRVAIRKPTSLGFEISNASPIPAYFTAKIDSKRQAKWSVEPNQGVIEKEESLNFSVTLTIMDSGNINAVLFLIVENSRVISIDLRAFGYGSSIFIEPNIFPEYDFGCVFSHHHYKVHLKLENDGSRHHLLQFLSKKVSTGATKTNDPEKWTYFQFVPSKLELAGGEKKEILLEGRCNSVREVCEEFTCWALINKQGLRQSLGSCTIRANFIAPVVELSETTIEFDINIGPNEIPDLTLIRELHIKNKTTLPITVELQTISPFSITDGKEMESEKEIYIQSNENFVLYIAFKSHPEPQLDSTVSRGTLKIAYREHPNQDKVHLIGRLNFPNVRLSYGAVNFGCIPLCTTDHRIITLTNRGPLEVNYKWKWNEEVTRIAYFSSKSKEITNANEADFQTLYFISEQSATNTDDNGSKFLAWPMDFKEVHPLLEKIAHPEDSNSVGVVQDLIHKKLSPLAAVYFNADSLLPIFDALPTESPQTNLINKVLDILPWRGCLKPFESQAVSIGFRPDMKLSLKATAVCHVEGGPADILTLTGLSDNHHFGISSTKLDFGFKLFTDICTEVVTLTNRGELDFVYKISAVKLVANSPTLERVMEAGMLTVEPSGNILPAHTTAELVVRYYPGIAGEFNETFMIEIDYLPPISVSVMGCGLFPQVSLNLPHIPRMKIPINWMYCAIATLTSPRFEFVSVYEHSRWKKSKITFRLIEDSELSDWCIISYDDDFPEAVDIDMAIERTIVHNLIKSNPTLLPQMFQSRNKSIPSLQVPGYVLDFGCVIIGTSVENTIIVENRGFVKVDFSLVFNMPEKKLKQDGVWIDNHTYVGLPVRRSVPIYVTLRPLPERYTATQEEINVQFYVKVTHGAMIPVLLKAVFTVPYIITDTTVINFGNVQCGHCKIVSILIKNVGHVSCEWSVSLKVGKKRKKESINCDIPFYVTNPTGIYPPKTAGILEIAFQPEEEETYEAQLQLKMMHNPEILVLRLQGCGVEPKLNISEEYINFGALLPHAEPAFKQVTISNPCQFPVEFYFTQYDNFMYDEDRVLRVLTHFYNEEKLILPQHLYMTRMLPELVQFYEGLCNELNVKLQASEESVDVERQEIEISVNEDPVLRKSEELILKSLTKGSSVQKNLSEMDPYVIEDLLHDYINERNERSTTPEDPLLLKLHTAPHSPDKPSGDRLESENGILIMFHGAPHSDYMYWANRAARKLSLKVINLDQMILEEASSSVKICALKVCEAINNKYEEMFQGTEVLESVEAENEIPVMGLDALTKKIELILSRLDQKIENQHQMKSHGSRKQNRPPVSKASKRGAATNLPDTEVFCNIPIETITELIGMRLREEVRSPGVVVESLTGTFLKNAHRVVHMLLSIVGNIGYIHFITLFINSETYYKWLELKEKEKELLKLQEQKRKIANFSRMTSQSIEMLNAEDRHVINLTLNARRERYREKLDIINAKKKGKLFNIQKLQREDRKQKKSQTSDGKRKDTYTKTQKTQRGTTSSRTRNAKKKETAHTQTRSMDKIRSRSVSHETKRSKSTESKSKDSSRKKKRRVTAAKKLIDNETEIKFERYEAELVSLSSMLESWNRLLRQMVGNVTDNLFGQTYSPTTKKSRPKRTTAAFSHQESTIKPVESRFVGIPITVIKLSEFRNLTSLYTNIIKLIATSPELNEARAKPVAWDDIEIPDPLSLICIVRPAARSKPTISHTFEISDVVEERFVGERNYETSDLKDKEENGRSIKSKPSNTAKRKTKRGSNKSLRPSISNDFNKDINTIPQFTARKILNPGEEMSWHIKFTPNYQNVFYEEIPLEISGWRKTYNLKCEAVCDIPRIDTDPKMMFQKVTESLNPVSISHCMYLLDTETFYFGPVLCSSQKGKDRTYELVTSFKFLNISEITAKITFSFKKHENYENEECFGFNHKMLIIQPGEFKQLEIYACPNISGKQHETLVYSIENNPKIEQIKLSCVGIIPSFDYNPKVINFDRVLLYRKEAHTLHLCNNCYEPLGWKLTGYEDLGEQVTISKVSGIIDPMTTSDVFFHFKAERVEVNNKTLNIEVYDSQFRGHPFVTEPLAVNVEAVDVLVDIIFPKQKFSYLHYKNIKVGKKEVLTFVMKNKGKYDIAFQIKFAEPHSEQLQCEPQSILSFSPKSGILQKTGKPVTVQVSCLCSKALNITEIPLLKVWLIDTGPKASPVATIPIGVSVTSFTAKFRVTPMQDVNFGPMIIGSKRTRTIIIENVGKFDLQYRILSREQANFEDDTVSRIKSILSTPKQKSKKEERKTTAASHLKIDKLQTISELQIGVFTVHKSGGELEISQSVNIDVDCYVTEVGKYEEEVVFRFNNCAPADRKGVTLKLLADVHCPKLNFDNKDFIFQEAQQVSTTNTCSPNGHGNPCVTYAPEDNTLRFLNVCVGFQKELALHVHLQNSELVPCEVIATILKSNKQTNDQVFSVSPAKMTIPSHCTRPVLIQFSPRQIGIFHDVLQLEVESPNSVMSQKFLCTLIGEGHLPQISITCPLPVLSCKPSKYMLYFPPTETGCYHEKLFTFQNTGSISCKAILELCENEKKVFSLAPASDTEAAVHMWNPEVGFENSAIVLVRPKQVCTFIVRFTPHAKTEEFCKLNLFTMNNPYEDQFVKVCGTGYSDDVFLKGLLTVHNVHTSASETNGDELVRKSDLLTRTGSQDIAENSDSKKTIFKHKFQNRVDNVVKSRFKSIDKKKLQNNEAATESLLVANKSENSGKQTPFSSRSEVPHVNYVLDFGSAYVSEVKKVMFKICNQSTTNLFRFEWTSAENLTLSPNAGHLSPGCNKDIVASFCSNQHHQELKKDIISCSISQIEHIKNPSADVVLPITKDWDAERKVVEWLQSSDENPVSIQRIVNQEEEPPYEVIEGTTRVIHVITSVVTDYANVICNTNNVVLPRTLVYECEEIMLTLENKSLIEAEYTWNILDIKRNIVDENTAAECGLVSVSSVRPKLQPLPYKHRQPLTASSSACKRPRPLTSSLSLFNERVDKTTSTTGLLYSTSVQFPPISVEPEGGKIPPNSSVTSKITFSPADLFTYTCKLLLKVEGKNPDNDPVEVSVTGTSMMPCCHLYIQDYKPTSITGVVDLHTHVLEFTIIGLDKAVTKFINMINPTDENYCFHWYEVKNHPAITISPFSCSKHSGHLQARKEMEIKFNFTPPRPGIFESHWILSIPARHIKKSIILIGTVSEPNVFFVPSYLKLKPTLKGITAIGSVALVNSEDTDLNFSVEKKSLLKSSAFLEVDPMQGVLEAHSQKLLSINMIPASGGITRFKVKVRVQKLKQPLVITVDGECFIIEPVLTYERSSKERIDMSTEEDNIINMGILTSRIPENLFFTLTNIGKPTIYYCWAWDSEAFEKACVSVNCFYLRGTVTSHSKTTLHVQLTPLRKVAFTNIRLTLETTKGPQYNVLLSGTASVPLYKFSFDNYNFGLCFVQTSKSKYYQVGLVFHNKDEVPLMLEKKSESSDAFTVEMMQSKVPARGEVIIPIYFHPMMCQPYEEVVTFSINNFFTFNLVLTGEVAELNVELVKKSDRLINFGAVVKGHTASRTVELINKSHVSLIGEFTVVSNNKEDSDKPDIVVEPSSLVMMIPNKIIKLVILYTPQVATKSFVKHVIMNFQDVKQVICMVKGSCIGAELHLDRYYIPFGSVILGNHSTARIILINTGDLTVKFAWRVKNMRVFTISPHEGYSTAGSETVLTITFCPDRPQAEIRTEAICEMDKFSDLRIMLTGTCVELPPPVDTILFSCPVRKYEEKQVTLNNNLGFAVQFSPVISGEYFSTNRVVELGPYSSAELNVVYSPLEMTGPEKVHEGTLTIPLEGGNCLLYLLQGLAEKPDAEASVLVKTSTHKYITKLLAVSNWLLTSQRFHVTIEPSEDNVQIVYLISENDYIDVPSKQFRDYTVKFMCFQPCMINFQVKFKNESTEEYQWYDLFFEVKQCNPIDKLKITTNVRKPVTQSICIENPLTVPAYFEKFSSTSEDIMCSTLLPSIEPLGKEEFVFQYLPFHITEETAELKLISPQLGLMLYTVQLTALPPKMESSVYISCELGQQASTTVCIHNNSAQEANFTSSVSHHDIKVDKIAKALPSETVNVTIVYEPSSLDNETIYVKIVSDEIGEFTFPVITTCLLPKPNGPIIIQEGSQMIIQFKNIFSETKTFCWYTENPVFSVDSTTATLESKQEIDIIVKMSEHVLDEMRNGLPATSKLTVTISDPSLQHVKWTYYLRGIYKT